MNPERWRQIEHLYHAALNMEPSRRDGFLAEACPEDAELRGEVTSLLDQTDATGALVDQATWTAACDAAPMQSIAKQGGRLGPYEIVDLLGAGGMGEVYSAIDTRLGRRVAIKVSRERFGGRFEREARTISALNHPNICTLFDVGPNYLVTELVKGETLDNWIQRGPPTSRVLEIARQVLDALHAAHLAGVVHRDLKPQNIMVRFDGYVKVLDFGLAKQISGLLAGDAATDETIPGEIRGTVAYMSPEQVRGEAVDQRSDLFAFGTVLCEMLTGQHPWRGASPVETLHAILHDEPRAIENIAPRVAPIVRKLLRKAVKDRFPSAEAVREALAESAVDQGVPAAADSAEPIDSIAVLPFLFLSEVEDRKALSLGFADALITTLGSLENFAVIPTSTIVNCVPGIDPAQTCRDLGVRQVLQGCVQKQATHWRVSTQLYDSQTQTITYAEKHDFTREDVFEVQDEIGRRVVQSLQARLKRAARKSRDRYSSDPEAYNEFMQGLSESYSDREDILRSSAHHLSEAVKFDPEFALAHATLSYVAMHIHWEFDPQRAWLEEAEFHCG
ncbi:MAG: protein kinase, partial [Silvibacterium sp.]|nr:protein kinase [Silvibacterium sp.]